jgi:hypothetical protein
MSAIQENLFNSKDYLEAARKAAVRIARERGSVSFDEVRRECPIPGGFHRNIAGGIFKTKQFIWSGVKKSTTPSRKGGMIGVYTLREQLNLKGC